MLSVHWCNKEMFSVSFVCLYWVIFALVLYKNRSCYEGPNQENNIVYINGQSNFSNIHVSNTKHRDDS
jgi:hypothetical protein